MSIVTGGLGQPRSGGIVTRGLGLVTVPTPPEPETVPVLGSFVLPRVERERVVRLIGTVTVTVTLSDTSIIRFTTPVEVTEEVTHTWRLFPADRAAADQEALALLLIDEDPAAAFALLVDAEERRTGV